MKMITKVGLVNFMTLLDLHTHRMNFLWYNVKLWGFSVFLSSEGLSWRVNTKMNTKHTLIANTRIFPISKYFLFPLQIQAEKEIGNIYMQAKTQITTEAIAFTSS